MSSAARSISPIKLSSASVTTTSVSVSSPNSNGQFSPGGPSTGSLSSSVSPHFPPPAPAAGLPPPPGGAQAFHHHHVHHNNHGAAQQQQHPSPPASQQSQAAAGSNMMSRPRASASPSTLPSPGEIRSISEARTALVASIGNMLDSELQSRAQLLHSNYAAIEKQRRDVEKAIMALRKEDDKLGKVVADGSRKFKELGDVQNWAERLERDFLVLEETMRLVREGDSGSESGSWSGSESSWSRSGSGSEVGGVDGDGDVQMQDEPAEEIIGSEPLGKGKANEMIPVEAAELDPTQVPLPSDDEQNITKPTSDIITVHEWEPRTTQASSSKATGWLRISFFKG